jgi:uncharacterized protein
MNHTIQINDHEFVLHPSGAIFWESESMLLIADVHLGKVEHFRKHGSALPLEVGYKNLETLTEVVNTFQARQVCFLGDLFHSKLNQSWEDFAAWVNYIPAEVILVNGNHDILPKYLYESLSIQTYDEMQIGSFLFTHHPTQRDNYFNFAGHIHPGVRMQGLGRQIVKLACFFRSKDQLILPAFGTFTGKHLLRPSCQDKIYVIVEGEVVSVSNT